MVGSVHFPLEVIRSWALSCSGDVEITVLAETLDDLVQRATERVSSPEVVCIYLDLFGFIYLFIEYVFGVYFVLFFC